MDSGDLAGLSTASKALIKHAGDVTGFDFSHVIVFASNDINESVLRKLNSTGHDVDAFGIGTNLVTCQAQPALGMVYKLVDIHGVAKIKLSDEREKTTLPGEKQIIRVYVEGGDGCVKPEMDVICLVGEADGIIERYNKGEVGQTIKAYEPFGEKVAEVKPVKVEALSVLMFDKGQITYGLPLLKDRRAECLSEFASFGGVDFLLAEDDKQYKVYLSEKC